MDRHGNSKFNPLNGVERGGINRIIPENLNEKYSKKVEEFEDQRRIKLPHTSNDTRKNIFRYY